MANNDTIQAGIMNAGEIGEAEAAELREAGTPTGDECIKCYSPLFCSEGLVRCVNGLCAVCGLAVDSDGEFEEVSDRHPSDIGPHIPFGSQYGRAVKGVLAVVFA